MLAVLSSGIFLTLFWKLALHEDNQILTHLE